MRLHESVAAWWSAVMAKGTLQLLSLLICTRNRRVLLDGVLASLQECRIPPEWQLELVIVDNGSTDGTTEAVAAAARQLPFPVQCVPEPTPGLGRAHATGLRACRGEIIACTDDDCYVSPGWCEAIVAAFDAQPELAGLFGRVVPVHEGGDPAWHVAVKTSEQPATYRFPCWPVIGFGNNMAFRREPLEAAGAFNPVFGPGGPLWSAEELEVTYRLLRKGHAVAYVPSALIRHRLRSTYESWAKTQVRDALGWGAFTGAYAIRGDLVAFKLFLWEWQGMATAWWQGLVRRDRRRRQVSGWYIRWMPFGLLAGLWHGLRRHPAPPAAAVVAFSEPAASPAPEVSVVICTRDRADGLRETLHSVLDAGRAPGVSVEVVVVDNGSRDHTRAVVEAFEQRHGSERISCVSEPRAGLARARNAGLRAARGTILAFTDDDCVAAADWIACVAATLRADQTLAGLFGRVLPLGGAITPSTISVKTSEVPRRYQFPCSPFVGHGNNMAFRRAALRSSGGFDVTLGPGAPLGAGEELDLAYRLLRRGHALAYEPSCVVTHRPRGSASQARATEWRNAIGIGACFGKHLLRGDWHAGKCLYWFLSGFVAPSARRQRTLESAAWRARWLVIVGVPYGVLKAVGFSLLGRSQAPLAQETIA